MFVLREEIENCLRKKNDDLCIYIFKVVCYTPWENRMILFDVIQYKTVVKLTRRRRTTRQNDWLNFFFFLYMFY